MNEKRKIYWRSDLKAATGWSDAKIKKLQQRKRLPPYDVLGLSGRPGHKGKGGGWYEEIFLNCEYIQEKKISLKEEEKESQNFASVSPEEGKLVVIGSTTLAPIPAENQKIIRVGPEEVAEYGSSQKTNLFIHSPEKAQRIAVRRKRGLNLWRRLKNPKDKRLFLEIWKRENPDLRASQRTFQRWDKQERDHGLDGVVPNWFGRDLSTICNEKYEIFKSFYLSPQKLAATKCHDLVKIKTGSENIPGPAAFLRRLKKESHGSDSFIDYHREGPKKWDAKWAFYVERDYESLRPGEWYCMDHAQLDVACSIEGAKSLFPWGTYVIDVRSRKFLSLVLGGPPNASVVGFSFARACIRHGIPLNFYSDRGKDFRSKVISGGIRPHRLKFDERETGDLLSGLGVVPHFTLPYSAQSKPIERLFRTVKDAFSRFFLGFRGGFLGERPEGLEKIIASGKILPVAEVEKLLWAWFEAVYNNSPHRGQGMDGRTPNQVWAEGNVARPVNDKNLFLLLLRSAGLRKVGRNGVILFDQVYFAEALLYLKGTEVPRLYFFTEK